MVAQQVHEIALRLVDIAEDEQRQRPSYVDDPVGFARDVLGHDPWETPEAIMRAVARPFASVAVKACHASAKTFTAAELVLWWVYAMDGIAISTAPTGTQVKELLWGEIHKAHDSALHPLTGRLNQQELRRTPGIFAIGRSTDQGVRFQGFHGERVLIVVDEAPGVDPEIDDAIDGIRAGGDVRVLKLGNPMLATGRFHDAFTTARRRWQTFTIDAFDTPNLAGLSLDELRTIPEDAGDDPRLAVAPRPYLVTRRYVHERFWEWGEDHPLWQAKVRGEFPSQSDDALISLAWLESAKRAVLEPLDDDEWVAGIDVAGPGEAETVVYVRHGAKIVASKTWTKPDPRGETVAFLAPWKERLTVNVDEIGIGHYFVLALRDEKFKVNGINVGEAPRNTEKYANLKAELYWGLRQRFTDGDIAGLTDDVAIGQLAGLRYTHNARGQVVIESKEAARRRGVKSPDRAEAIMLCFAKRASRKVQIL